MRDSHIPTIETLPHELSPGSPGADDGPNPRVLPRTCVANDAPAASLPSEPAIALVAASGRYLRANAAWRRGVGAPILSSPTIEGRAAIGVHGDAPAVGRMIHDVPPPLPAREWTAAWQDALGGQSSGWRLTSTADASGHRHDVRWSMEPVRTPADGIDDVAEVVIVIERTSECLRCLEDSKRAIARFSALSQMTFDVVFLMNADWSTMRRIGGADPDAGSTIDSMRWIEQFIPIENRPTVFDAVTNAIAERSSVDLEHRYIRRDGTVGWMHSRAVPILDADGVPTEWIGASLDITDRRAATTSLRERQRHLAAVVETAADAILTIDSAGRITSANAATREIFGHHVHAILGRHISILLPDIPREGCCSDLLDMANEGCETSRVRGRSRLGDSIPLRLTVTHIDDSAACVAFLHDMTDEDSTNHRLQETSRLGAIGTLAAGIGHDMNTILLPIRARLDGIESDGVPEAIRGEFLEVRRGLGFLQDLADGLHQLMINPDSDGGVAQSTCIPDWWRHGRQLLQRALPAKTRFLEHVPHDLPAIGMAPHQLTQAMLNLLSNAGKAIPEGGTVALWARVDLDGDVVIGVSDNGAGMREAVRRRAADPFFTTRRRGKGTGLGLALVHGVAAKSGGVLDIESIPGAGTTVALTIPAVEVTHVAPDDQVRGHVRLRVRDTRTASILAHLLALESFATIEDADGGRDGRGDPDAEPNEILVQIVDADDWTETGSEMTGTASCPTILIGHSKDRPDAFDAEGVAYLESNLSFDHIRAELRSALERILPC